MIPFALSLFIFLASNVHAMTRHANVSPATKKRAAAKKVEAPAIPSNSKWKPQLDYSVNPNIIKNIFSEDVFLPEGKALAYNAILNNGSEVACCFFLEGIFKGEKWALLSTDDEDDKPTPIPQENFDIIEQIYKSNP